MDGVGEAITAFFVFVFIILLIGMLGSGLLELVVGWL